MQWPLTIFLWLLWHAEASVYKPRPSPPPSDQPQEADPRRMQAAGPLPPPLQQHQSWHLAAEQQDEVGEAQ